MNKEQLTIEFNQIKKGKKWVFSSNEQPVFNMLIS